jgi:hypothetical protein
LFWVHVYLQQTYLGITTRISPLFWENDNFQEPEIS